MHPAAFLFPALFLLALPLLASLVIGWVGSFTSRKTSAEVLHASSGSQAMGWLAAGSTLVGLLYSLFFVSPSEISTLQYNWVTLGTSTLPLSFRLDYLTWLMLLLVHFIALLVQLYSIAYMRHDPARRRYFAFIQLFVFSMLGIVLAGNLLMMYIFWELVGLSSYLLIGFWHHKPRAVWAAKKAFILNRIGDVAFLTGILLLLHGVGTTDFSALPSALAAVSEGKNGPVMLTTIGLCLFGGCVGKSAQFPLSAWLPDAMEGPTPVSALIHAATMVAAGIFLLARISFLLTPTAQGVVAVVGSITMLHGAWKAMQAWDIKRLLAYSTISQLGLMVVAVGVGSWQAAMFHLVTHAFFKAGLFLSAGSVIHALSPGSSTLGSSTPGSSTPAISTPGSTPFDPQDMRQMGGLRVLMPRTFLCFVVCAAALAGIPLFSGFLSKDALFTTAFVRAAEAGGVWYAFPIFAVLAAGLTAYYMVRQVWLVFMGEKRYSPELQVEPHESPALMWVPMALLASGSLFIWFSPHPFDAFSGWFLSRLHPEPVAHVTWVPLLSVIVTGLALAVVYRRTRQSEGFFKPSLLEKYSDRKSRWQRPLVWLSPYADHREATQHQTFFLIFLQKAAVFCARFEAKVVDALVDAVGVLMVVLAHITGWTDRNITDGAVQVVTGTARGAGQVVRMFQNGKIQSYFLLTFVSLLLLLLWVMVL